MLPTTDNANIPYPSASDAPNVPADMQALGEHLDTRVVLRAADAAERDALYSPPPPGMVCVGSDGTTWVADDSETWHTIYRPLPPWRSLSLASGIEGSQPPMVRVIDGQVWLQGQVITSNEEPFGGGTTVAFLPNDAMPPTTRHFSAATSVAGARTYNSLRLGINAGGDIYVSVDQDPDGGAQWAELTGINYWVDD